MNKPDKRPMERDALEIEQRFGIQPQPVRYGLAAAAIWIAIAYGLSAPVARTGSHGARAGFVPANGLAKVSCPK